MHSGTEARPPIHGPHITFSIHAVTALPITVQAQQTGLYLTTFTSEQDKPDFPTVMTANPITEAHTIATGTITHNHAHR